MRKLTSDLKIGDTIEVCWDSIHGDRVVAIEPRVCPQFGPCVVLRFASGTGMTAFAGEVHKIIHAA